MHDRKRTKAQLLEELQDLRRRVARLEENRTDTERPVDTIGKEEALQVIEAMADPLLLLKMDGRFLFINQAHEAMSGYSKEEVRGKHFSEFLQETVKEDELEEIGRVTEAAFGAKNTPPLEFTFVTKKGTEVPVSARASFVNDEKEEPSGIVVTFRDLTEQRQAERTLRESEERFRALFEGSLDAIVVFDPQSGMILDANPAASELLSRPLQDIIGMHYLRMAPPRIESEARRLFETQVEESDPGQPVETAVLASDGTEVPVEVLAQIIQLDGVPVLMGTFRNLTERKRAEQALRHSEERYRLLAQNSPDIITIINPDYTFRYISPASERILGYTPEEVIEHMGFDHVHPEDRATTVAQFARLMKSPDRDSTHTYRLRHKDGSWRFVEALGNNCLANPAMRAVVLNVRDVTERKRAEEALEKAERLESLGILCGGIAHDFNNILTAVLTNISMAQIYGALDEETGKMLADAEKASLRAQGLTQQLLTFAKGGDPVKKTVLVPRLIKDTVDFALSGSDVKCEYDIATDLWPVEADEGQIGQVIQNVVLNADQAMPAGGVIRVRAENAVIAERDPLPLKPGRHVKITLSDQGIGIPPEHLKRVFDPFFTTKQKGSGLGLSTSFSIVKRHNGTLRIESRLGEGTTVCIYLPARPEVRIAERLRKENLYTGEGRVLLVDDDDTLRKTVGKALGRLGYEVHLAEDGAQGIALYEEALSSGRPVDVVVMDLTIPGGMGGKETARELLRTHPAAKIVVSSGYSTDPVMSDFRAHGFRAVISKPYRIEDLGDTLRKVLADE